MTSIVNLAFSMKGRFSNGDYGRSEEEEVRKESFSARSMEKAKLTMDG